MRKWSILQKKFKGLPAWPKNATIVPVPKMDGAWKSFNGSRADIGEPCDPTPPPGRVKKNAI